MSTWDRRRSRRWWSIQGRRAIVWSEYRRHETRLAETLLQLLVDIGDEFADIAARPDPCLRHRLGLGSAAPSRSARSSCRKSTPSRWRSRRCIPTPAAWSSSADRTRRSSCSRTTASGGKRASASMNDKCASGTGATIDKCLIKVGMPREEIGKLQWDPSRLHHVAAKCGVFAETDIVNLVKAGIPSSEMMCSLADAIVLQNLSVLTRGNTLQAQSAAAGRTERLSAVPASVLAAANSRDVAGSRVCVSPRRAGRSAHRRTRQRRVLRGLRRGPLRIARTGAHRPIPRPRSAQRVCGRWPNRAACGLGRARPGVRARRARGVPPRLRDPGVRAGDVRARHARAEQWLASTAARPRPRPC